MAPKKSPRSSSGSKKSQSKGDKDAAKATSQSDDVADAEAKRKKEELARKVRERLKAKQAAEAAKKDVGAGAKRERGDDDDDATGDREDEKASSKRRRTAEPTPTPSTAGEIQPIADDNDAGKDPAADLATQMRERRERSAAAGAGMDDGDARTAVSDRVRPPGWRLDEDEDLAGMDDDDDEDGDEPSVANKPTNDDDDDDDEVDPLEAFMAANDSVMDAERAAAAKRREDRETHQRKRREEKISKKAETDAAADFFAVAAKAAKAAKAALEGVGDNDAMDVDANVDPDTGLPPLKKPGNGDDDDPLDAFMRANNAKADAAVAKAAARVPAPVVRAKPAIGTHATARPVVLKKPASSTFLKGITVKAPKLVKPGKKEGGRVVKKIGLVRRFFDADSDGGDSSSDDGPGGADSDSDAGSGSDDDAEWVEHCTGRADRAPSEAPAPTIDLASLAGRFDTERVEVGGYPRNPYLELGGRWPARKSSLELEERGPQSCTCHLGGGGL